MDAIVSSLYTYSDSGAAGQQLVTVAITSDGPEGNRSKKHAVHLVTATEYVTEHPKANIVLDMEAAVLHQLVGKVVRLGDCTLAVTRRPSSCAGVYADVVHPGEVSVDDHLLVADDA